jgi:glutaredoxin 3
VLLFVFVSNPNYLYILTIKIITMSKSIFYHAGCPVCLSAEHDIIDLLGSENVDVVHFGEDRSRIEEAESAGVKSVPALVTPNGNVLHLNFGASMADVKG